MYFKDAYIALNYYLYAYALDFCVAFLLCYLVVCVPSSFTIILTACFTSVVFLLVCGCLYSVALSPCAVGWTVVCDVAFSCFPHLFV